MYRDLDASAAQIHILDYGDALLKPFSEKAHAYVAKVLEEKGVQIHLGTGVKEVGSGHAVFSDGTTVATRCVVWGGGIKAAPVAADGGLAHGRGGRVDVEPDLTLAGHEGVYVVGDIANIPDKDERLRCRSLARSRCRAVAGPPRTSWPTSRASPASPSPITTRGSWR